MESHQYKIRVKKENEEKDSLDFNINDVSLKNTLIKQISRNDASKIILEYEWLKSIPPFSKYYFGIFFQINNKEYLGGVLIFSEEYSSNTTAWDKYSFKDELLLLSRGVCLWWTPKNTASYFISKIYKYLLDNTKYRAITATVDPMAGEIGVIYQSLNWCFLDTINTKTKTRFGVIINNKLYGSRSIKRKVGSIKKEDILALYPDAIFAKQYRKKRYIYFIGKNKKRYIKEVSNVIKPYPTKSLDNEYYGIIYKITNNINNKVYIGQTTRDLETRMSEYSSAHKSCNEYIRNSIKKHGFHNFNYQIIDTCMNLLELNYKEIYWINYFNSTNKENGYNISLGGTNSITSDITKERMSLSHKGIKQSDIWVSNRISKSGSEEAKKYSKLKTVEEKENLSKISKGENAYWFGKKRDLTNMKNIKIEKYGKKVIEFNRITNEVINRFNSIGEAVKSTGKTFDTITRHCNNNVKKYQSDISYMWN